MADELGDGALSELALGQSADARFGRPKSRGGQDIRVLDPDQGLLLPSLDDWLSAEHLARLIAELVDEHLDLVPFGPHTPRDAPRHTVIRG